MLLNLIVILLLLVNVKMVIGKIPRISFVKIVMKIVLLVLEIQQLVLNVLRKCILVENGNVKIVRYHVLLVWMMIVVYLVILVQLG